jgi:type IV fimbrial biogenesis protein FimT
MARECQCGSRIGGLTLIELLVAIAVLAVLLTVAVPSFDNARLGTNLVSFTNTLLAHLQLARSEAIKRNARVALCKSADGSTCMATGGWDQGWIIFHDANNNGSREDSETVIQRGETLATGFSLTGNTPVARYISYDATGATKLTSGAFQAGTLTLCRAAPTVGGQGRKIVISATGRPRVEQTNNVTACP